MTQYRTERHRVQAARRGAPVPSIGPLTAHSHDDASSTRAWVLPTHIASAALVTSTTVTVAAILPVIAKKHFHASDTQSVLVTAAPTASYVLSIFFNHIFARRRFGSYLAQYWLLACVPMAVMGLAHEFWQLLVPFLVACIGGAGYHPVAGELLKRLYPDSIRGRIYAIVWGSSILGSAGLGYGVGEWLKHNPEAFRVFLPLFAGLQGLGLLGYWAMWRLTHQTRELAHGGSMFQLLEPVVHMRRVLRDDPTFARYEASYMAYGIGWMICWALLPLMGVRMGLNYDQYAHSTQVAYQIMLVLAIYPAGLLMDRMGAIRSTALSFLLLTFYPLGLMLVSSEPQLIVVSAFYGVAHAGANMGWMLGPVSLAPTREKVAQYVAIHSTLVGVRGAVFQFLGVWVYVLTGSFIVPLAMAALGFAISAWQMFSLHRRQTVRTRTPEPTPQTTLEGK